MQGLMALTVFFCCNHTVVMSSEWIIVNTAESTFISYSLLLLYCIEDGSTRANLNESAKYNDNNILSVASITVMVNENN